MTALSPEPRRLHPATLITRWLRIVPQMLGGGAAYAAVIAREGLGRVLLIAGLAGLIGIVATLIAWWRFRYTVGAGEIVIESGLFQRQRRVIPFDRVQDIAIERRPIARLLGTAKVRIETGGSAADEGNLDMIALDDAMALRDHIRGVRATVETAEAEPAPDEEPLLFEMAFGRLLYAGLFNFSLVFLAGIFAVLQYLDEWQFVQIEQWFSPERADAAAGAFNLPLALAGIALLVLAGIVAGIVRTVTRDFGFRLTRSQAGLRRRRGLLTLSEVVIPIRRTQVAVIESGPVTRRLGWYRLSFQTLGADRKEGGLQVAAPFARMAELVPILAEAGFPLPPPRDAFERLPRRALVRWAGQYLVIGAVLAAAALFFEPIAGFAALALLLLALFGALRWRKHSYALDERALLVSGGLLNRRIWILPFEKAQAISLSRGPLQRRLNLASLLVDTAGASLVRTPEIVDLDGADAELLADRLLALFYQARSAARLQPG